MFVEQHDFGYFWQIESKYLKALKGQGLVYR
jgi:hypothetical protein